MKSLSSQLGKSELTSLTESILDDDFDTTIDKTYEKNLKNLTKLRDDLVKFIGNWHKLDKDGDGYSTDDWEFYDGDWWDIRSHIFQEFQKLIKKHHLDNMLMVWTPTPRIDSDGIKIINRKGTRTTHISLIWIDWTVDGDDQYASVWIEDPKYFLELLLKQ